MALVHSSRHVDVFLLYHLCPGTVEKTAKRLVTSPRPFGSERNTSLYPYLELYKNGNNT